MANTLQDFFAAATQKAADNLVTAFLRLPEDRRNWSPGDKARTAIDQMAECALLNGYTAHLIQTREWPISSFDVFFQEKAELAAGDWEQLHARLQTNTATLITAIGAVSDEQLGTEIQMPWEKQTLAQILAYPYWNMAYHEGQINYIASMLGCL